MSSTQYERSEIALPILLGVGKSGSIFGDGVYLLPNFVLIPNQMLFLSLGFV